MTAKNAKKDKNAKVVEEEVNRTVVNRNSGYRIDYELLAGMNEEELVKAMKFWLTQIDKTVAKKTRPEWSNLGKVCIDAKQAVNGNTKKFGAWRDKHFPNINAPTVSQAMKFHVHFNVLDAWCEKNRPHLSHPMEIIRLYQNKEKVKLGIDGKVEKKTTDSSSSGTPKDTDDTGIAGVIKAFQDSSSRMRKAFENMPEAERKVIAAINYLNTQTVLKVAGKELIETVEEEQSKKQTANELRDKYTKAKGRAA